MDNNRQMCVRRQPETGPNCLILFWFCEPPRGSVSLSGRARIARDTFFDTQPEEHTKERLKETKSKQFYPIPDSISRTISIDRV